MQYVLDLRIARRLQMKLIGIKILIKKLFCKHNKAYIEELHYGDVITLYNGKRQR